MHPKMMTDDKSISITNYGANERLLKFIFSNNMKNDNQSKEYKDDYVFICEKKKTYIVFLSDEEKAETALILYITDDCEFEVDNIFIRIFKHSLLNFTEIDNLIQPTSIIYHITDPDLNRIDEIIDDFKNNRFK